MKISVLALRKGLRKWSALSKPFWIRALRAPIVATERSRSWPRISAPLPSRAPPPNRAQTYRMTSLSPLDVSLRKSEEDNQRPAKPVAVGRREDIRARSRRIVVGLRPTERNRPAYT